MKNKVAIKSYFDFYTKVGATVGLVLGIVYSFGGLLIDSLVSLGWVTSSETSGLSMGTVLAFGALIGMPLIFGMLGCWDFWLAV